MIQASAFQLQTAPCTTAGTARLQHFLRKSVQREQRSNFVFSFPLKNFTLWAVSLSAAVYPPPAVRSCRELLGLSVTVVPVIPRWDSGLSARPPLPELLLGASKEEGSQKRSVVCCELPGVATFSLLGRIY